MNFLIKKMGFHEKWRGWINMCLQSTSDSVLVNGSPTKDFKMSIGLRQRNPFSPFLFLKASEGFNIIMQKVVEVGKCKAFKFEGSNIQVSHLYFVDDTLIIGERS